MRPNKLILLTVFVMPFFITNSFSTESSKFSPELRPMPYATKDIPDLDFQSILDPNDLVNEGRRYFPEDGRPLKAWDVLTQGQSLMPIDECDSSPSVRDRCETIYEDEEDDKSELEDSFYDDSTTIQGTKKRYRGNILDPISSVYDSHKRHCVESLRD